MADPALLYEENQEKTRVLITGSSPEIAGFVLKILQFCGKEVDLVLPDGTENFNGNDFLILGHNQLTGLENFRPTIVLLATENSTEDFTPLVNHMTGGGIFIFNENDENAAQAADSADNYFRKLSYKKPLTANGTLSTEYGDIPLTFSHEISEHIDGAKLLCQQLGIMEEQFYEAVATF